MKKEFLIFSIVLMAFMACKKDRSDAQGLELVFADDTYQLTGVAKEPSGRLWVNYPRWSDIYRYAVVTAEGNTVKPYPNEAFNNWQPGQDGQNMWVCVQSVYVDNGGGLWILDPAAPMMKTIQGNGAKLVKMNKTTNLPERSYSFMNIVPDTAYVNDVRVDVSKNFAYLSESKGGGIIVVTSLPARCAGY
ncbi:hypothetical protein [Pedobacter sp. Leaf176]|uniref:hypothetical protein n=1 Tax=Pedobacter sp. Leaf176 TaxID=1736286 RepID=UPI000ACE88CE|nr:hypothetical protein [Pedobacter sp. Leaf176]